MKTRQDACSLVAEVVLAGVSLLALLVLVCDQTPAVARSTPPQAVTSDVIADWQGAIGKQRMGLKVEAAETGGFKATLLLPDQKGELSLRFRHLAK